jgi:hypothetical protein
LRRQRVRLQGVSQPRRAGSQTKISKTTPCNVGRRRHGCSEQHLTCRANQRHFFIVAQSVKRRLGAQWRAVRCDFGRKSYPRLKLHWPVKLQWLAAARDRLPVPSRRASDARAGEYRHEHRSEPKYGNGDYNTRSNQGCRSRSRRYRLDIVSGDLPAARRDARYAFARRRWSGEAKEPAQRSAVKAASRRSRSRTGYPVGSLGRPQHHSATAKQ